MNWKHRLPILLIFLAMFIVAFFSFTSSPSDKVKKQMEENKKAVDQLKKKLSITPTATLTPTPVFRNFNPQPTVAHSSSVSTQKETIKETNTIKETTPQPQPTTSQPTPTPQPTSPLDPICNLLHIC